MKRTLTIIGIILLLAAAIYGYSTYSSAQRAKAAQAAMQTVPLAKGSLSATVGATGTVRSNQSAVLSWQTSGTVDQVSVQVGDQVSAGQQLANLAQSSLPQSVILSQADLVSAQQALNNLLDSQLQQAQAKQAVDNAQQALDDALDPELAQAQASQAVADAQKAVQDAQTNLINAESSASQSLINQAQANVTLTKNNLDKAQEKYNPYAGKPESNLTRARLLSDLAAAQQKYDAAVQQLNSLQGTASSTDLAVLQTALTTAQAQLANAQQQYARIQNGTSPADLAVLQAQLADAQRAYQRVQNGPNPDDVAAARARVAAAQASLDQAHLTAPFTGTITEVDSQPGDQVSPGTPAFRIDDLSHLWVDVAVSEVDVNQVKVGQPATLSFDAIQGRTYHGVVSSIAPVGSESQGSVNFTVTVELQDADAQVRPAMTAAVEIVVDHVEGALLIPNQAVRVINGQRVVYVMGANGVVKPVQITLGASSDQDSQLLTGNLQAGDLIVLNPPSQGPVGSGGGGPRFLVGNGGQ